MASDSSSSPPSEYSSRPPPLYEWTQQHLERTIQTQLSKLHEAWEQNKNTLDTLKQNSLSVEDTKMVKDAEAHFKAMRIRIEECRAALEKSQKEFYKNSMVKDVRAEEKTREIAAGSSKRKRA